ncbi:delta-60 repeat domain-containing protein [Pseudomonas syringae]|uniref:delta-60 repeat domain-containing protein n=1 Tax=Pseudomonas syringae TaxID=317 RepID=UPI0023F7CFD4|nr:delta-60 repeat domain-containing protein [Pseudomonas syringae]MDF5777373.1 delta-60 repeat domain-containing protein [Pseudomonas syringae pv. syringae]
MMKSTSKAGGIEYEFQAPFRAPRDMGHQTKILALDSGMRYLTDLEHSSSRVFLSRLSNDGTPDLSFAPDGYRTESVEMAFDGLEPGLVVRKDGGVIAALCNDNELGLVCFKTDGTLDPDFGTDGIIVHSYWAVGITQRSGQLDDVDSDDKSAPSGKDVAGARGTIAPGMDGRIYGLIGGRTSSPDAVIRCLGNGELDAGFNETGTLPITYTTYDAVVSGVVPTPDGGIAVTGRLRGAVFVSCYKEDGSLNVQFGEGGFAIFGPEHFGYTDEEILQLEFNHIAVLPGGGFIVSGYLSAINPTLTYGLLVAVDSTGKLAQSFNNGKPVMFELAPREVDFIFGGVVLQADGKILVGGGLTARNPTYRRDVFVIRYLQTGELDLSFAGRGWVQFSPFGNVVSYLNSISIDKDQKILLAGDGGPDNNLSSMTGFVMQLAS